MATATQRDRMLWPAIALVAAQLAHGFLLTPITEDSHGNEIEQSGSIVGAVGGLVLLAASVAAVVGLVQRRPYGRPLAAWTGLVVAVGFVAYHGVSWDTPFTNPYLDQPIGPRAWIGFALAFAAGIWCAVEGREAITAKLGRSTPAAT